MTLLEERLSEVIFPHNQHLYKGFEIKYKIPFHEIIIKEHEYLVKILKCHRDRLEHFHGEQLSNKYFAMFEAYLSHNGGNHDI